MSTKHYDLTEPQRQALEARLKSLRGRKSYTDLALQMLGDDSFDRGSKQVKNLSSYVGEAFRGKQRGLRYVFGDPERLEGLARALGHDLTSESLSGLLHKVVEELPSHDRILASGLEDLGDLPLSDVWVCPPSSGLSGPLDVDGLRQLCFGQTGASAKRTTAIWGPPGSGTTTLLQMIAWWGAREGYVVHAWKGAEYPPTRGALLLADGVLPSRLNSIVDWTKRGDRRSVVVLDTRSPLARPVADVAIHPVDHAWLNAWCDQVSRLPAAQRRWLPRDRLPLIRNVLSYPRPLGPEEATTLLRWWATHPQEGAPKPVHAVHEALKRRAGRDAAGILPTVGTLQTLDEEPVEQALRLGVAEEVQQDLTEARLSATSRRILERALPAIDLTERVQQLCALGLLRRGVRGPEVRFAALLKHPSQVSDVERMRTLESGEPAEVIATWLDLEGTGVEMRWTVRAFQRCLAIVLLSGLGTLPGKRIVANHPGNLKPFANCAGCSLAQLVETVRECAADLDASPDAWSEPDLALASALTNRHVDSLKEPLLWGAVQQRGILPSFWLDLLRGSEDLASIALDPTLALGGVWFLTRPVLGPYTTELLVDLAEREPDAFANLVLRILDWVAEGPSPEDEPNDVWRLHALEALDRALSIRAPRQATRTIQDALAARVQAMFDACPTELLVQPPQLRQLALLAVGQAARTQLCEQAAELTSTLTVLAALDVLDPLQTKTLLHRLESGAIADPTAESEVTRTSLVHQHALRTLTLPDLDVVWPEARNELEVVTRDAPWPTWRSWPSAREYCWGHPPPFTPDHPVWRTVLLHPRVPPLESIFPNAGNTLTVPPLFAKGKSQDILFVSTLGHIDQLSLTIPHGWARAPVAMEGPLNEVLDQIEDPVVWSTLVHTIAEQCTSRLAILEKLEPSRLPQQPTKLHLRALLGVLRAARRETSSATDDWLAMLLEQRPDLADHERLQEQWGAYGGPTDPIEAWLLQEDGPEARGMGVLAAFSTAAELEPWLRRPTTEQAAWERLILTSDEGMDLLTTPRLPSDRALGMLRKKGELEKLIDASLTWEPAVRSELWRRAARVYKGALRAHLLASSLS